jgi:transcriptional regulator with XRE-family HTH domain
MLRIRDIRKAKKISQEDLAKLTGLSVRMLVQYEKEDADIPFKKMQLIAHSLGVTVADLLPSEENSARSLQLSEPATIYETSKNTLLETKDKMIDLLERENKDLREDKEFFRDLLKSKFITP